LAANDVTIRRVDDSVAVHVGIEIRAPAFEVRLHGILIAAVHCAIPVGVTQQTIKRLQRLVAAVAVGVDRDAIIAVADR
jgi:hypothetical protein